MKSLEDEILSSLEEEIKKPIIGTYILELGVFSSNKYRKTEKVNLDIFGLTNAELMFIHENGSPARSIPSRPVLELTITWAKDNIIPETINRCLDKVISGEWTQTDVEKELNIMAQRIQKYARDIIYSNDGRLAPNSPRTKKSNGKYENHPLFDTGQLARSIRCKIIKL